VVDPGTGLTVLGGALGSKDLVVKILGPTADYLGAGLANWTERAVENTGRVFQKAAKKLGNKLEDPGTVPPKVLKGILENAPFCNDELGAEYFGGVLASSRSGTERDDRGAAFIALLGRLSTYQIRSHFFFYKIIRMLYQGLAENVGVHEGREKLETFVPMNAYAIAMELGKNENLYMILTHVTFGLSREALIGREFLFGSPESLRSLYYNADVNGLLFMPSALGIELFLWVHGKRDLNLNTLLDPEIDIAVDIQISTGPGIRSTRFPDRKLSDLPKGSLTE